MKILALEFASERRAVAVVVEGHLHGDAIEIGGRTTRSCALIERALHQAGLEREAIECIAVGLGPGSYTGIRAAIAVAQGWQLGRDVRLLGISTIDCLVAQVQATGIAGRLYVAIDAQRNEFYLAGYQLSEKEASQSEALHLASLGEVQKKALLGTLLIWPELQAVFPQGKVLAPDAAMLGKLAAVRDDFVGGEKLEPIYLREAAFVKAAPPRLIP